MNGKVLSMTASVFILIVFSGTFIYNNKVKKTTIYSPTEVVNKVNSSEDKTQQPQLDNNENSKQDFFIKKDSMNIFKLIGVQGKFGLTEPLYGNNNFIYTTLYLWGNGSEILNKQLKIIAVNSSGESIEVPNLYRITKEGHGDVTEKNTLSTARENLSIGLPKNGIWNLNIYLDNVLLGNAVMDINSNGNNSKIPTPLQKN